ncbi:uncharacterized protein F4807DRAFT_406116 [Annulohypoxylon truncatum]|uniref:uncharacterized protein n=1 Tax=Annulohypoxylon truncatum TaxID=327061 RepID=UPI0020089EFD|nr:uncharacterized protein F4807DRAFT_406116 [Annulohypoxylon truncatum]KAI1215158.1 hypothetical protein F4807DRAFT_406116 [Annulohypoxylon truncatum]
MANINLQIKSLPSGAVAEFEKVSKWLRSNAAEFQNINGIKICKNTKGLADITNHLLKQFARVVESTSSQNRITAIHFDHSAAVPVEEGWVVDLMPVDVDEGPVTVGSQKLNLGQYVHLNEEADVSGNFFALLLLSQLDV